MAKIGEAELKIQIKSREFSNAYLIYGDEAYLKEFYIAQLKKKIVDPAFESFNLHLFEGNDIDLDDALKDAEMLPMMSEYNLVLIRDYPAEKNKGDVKAISEYLADMPDTTIFVMTFEQHTPDEKSANFKNIIKAFDSAGAVVNLQKRTETEVAKLLVNGAKRRGTTLDINNAKYLISISGNDLKILLNELDKLCGFVNGGEITKQIIDDMATKCLQARVYDLSKAVTAGNADMAYSVLDTLFIMREDPIYMLAIIGGIYVDMYRVKCAKTAGFSYNDVAEHYNYRNREFALKNASRDCARLTERQLRSSIDAIIEADTKLKSTSIDPKLLLEELIAKLLIISQEGSYA